MNPVFKCWIYTAPSIYDELCEVQWRLEDLHQETIFRIANFLGLAKPIIGFSSEIRQALGMPEVNSQETRDHSHIFEDVEKWFSASHPQAENQLYSEWIRDCYAPFYRENMTISESFFQAVELGISNYKAPSFPLFEREEVAKEDDILADLEEY